jgi:hypothetical protein
MLLKLNLGEPLRPLESKFQKSMLLAFQQFTDHYIKRCFIGNIMLSIPTKIDLKDCKNNT